MGKKIALYKYNSNDITKFLKAQHGYYKAQEREKIKRSQKLCRHQNHREYDNTRHIIYTFTLHVGLSHAS